MLIVIYFILLLIIIFCIGPALAAIKTGAESGNKNGYLIGITFMVIIFVCLWLFCALPDIQPTCTLDGLL